MTLQETGIEGLVIVTPKPFHDERGTFTRVFCHDKLHSLGIDFSISQVNRSVTTHAGTVRGMHFQKTPHAEAKLIQCLKGSVYDVAVDMRPESSTYLQWYGTELSEENMKMYYLPEGFAHGFQSLTDQVELLYFMSTPYVPESASGVRWNDPRIQIEWKLPISTIAEKDSEWPFISDSI